MKLALFVTFALIFSNSLIAAGSLGKHVHGAVGLDMAVEGKQVLLMLKGPADSFLGFEYQTKTSEEKKKFEQVKTLFTKELSSVLGGAAFKNCRPNDLSFKQVFQGKNHSEIQFETYLTCAENVAGKSFQIDLKKKFSKIETIDLQLLHENGKATSKKIKTNSFEISL